MYGRNFQNEKMTDAVIKSEWKVTVLLLCFPFKFAWNVLLINSENHKLQKACSLDKNICLAVLFPLFFAREIIKELRGKSQTESRKPSEMIVSINGEHFLEEPCLSMLLVCF